MKHRLALIRCVGNADTSGVRVAPDIQPRNRKARARRRLRQRLLWATKNDGVILDTALLFRTGEVAQIWCTNQSANACTDRATVVRRILLVKRYVVIANIHAARVVLVFQARESLITISTILMTANPNALEFLAAPTDGPVCGSTGSVVNVRQHLLKSQGYVAVVVPIGMILVSGTRPRNLSINPPTEKNSV